MAENGIVHVADAEMQTDEASDLSPLTLGNLSSMGSVGTSTQQENMPQLEIDSSKSTNENESDTSEENSEETDSSDMCCLDFLKGKWAKWFSTQDVVPDAYRPSGQNIPMERLCRSSAMWHVQREQNVRPGQWQQPQLQNLQCRALVNNPIQCRPPVSQTPQNRTSVSQPLQSRPPVSQPPQNRPSVGLPLQSQPPVTKLLQTRRSFSQPLQSRSPVSQPLLSRPSVSQPLVNPPLQGRPPPSQVLQCRPLVRQPRHGQPLQIQLRQYQNIPSQLRFSQFVTPLIREIPPSPNESDSNNVTDSPTVLQNFNVSNYLEINHERRRRSTSSQLSSRRSTSPYMEGIPLVNQGLLRRRTSSAPALTTITEEWNEGITCNCSYTAEAPGNIPQGLPTIVPTLVVGTHVCPRPGRELIHPPYAIHNPATCAECAALVRRGQRPRYCLRIRGHPVYCKVKTFGWLVYFCSHFVGFETVYLLPRRSDIAFAEFTSFENARNAHRCLNGFYVTTRHSLQTGLFVIPSDIYINEDFLF